MQHVLGTLAKCTSFLFAAKKKKNLSTKAAENKLSTLS